MNPYGRWRHAVWAAGVVVIVLLTAAILLTVLGLFLGWFAAQGATPAGR